MSSSETLDRILQTCDYRYRTVICPHKKREADVTAAKWQISDDHWTPWTVVDCSLLPAGQVWCDMTCLPLAENSPK